MKRQIREYLEKLEKIMKGNIKNKDEVLKELVTKIGFYQHERIVHIIVTVFVGLVSIAFLLAGMVMKDLLFFVPFFITLILFLVYIFHYYFLENHIQRLYDIYTEIIEKK